MQPTVKLNKPIPNALDPRVKPGVTNPTVEQITKTDNASITKANFVDTSKVLDIAPANPESLKPKLGKYEPEPVLCALPSFGRSIPKQYQHFLTDKKEIYIRRISSTEEAIVGKIRQTPEKVLTIISECLDRCIKTNIPLKYYMLIDKIPMFLFLLNISYTKENDPIEVECPTCGQKHARQVNLRNDINIRYMNADITYPLSFTTKDSYADKYVIEFDAPTFEHESLLEDENIEASQLLHNLVINIYNTTTNKPVHKEEWADLINYLDYDDRITFRDTLANISDNYGTDVKIDFSCENKGCMDYNKSVKVDLPLDQIFINLAKNKAL